jgi:hypothetical protein
MDRPMTAPGPPISPGPAPGDGEPTRGETDTSGAALSTLRGAGVNVDVRRAGRVIGGLCLVVLAVLAVALIAVGAHKNDQITSLHQHGVHVTITVTGCRGLLGGSGSNAAGYACRGNLTLHGRRYNEPIPGDTLYAPGVKVPGVAVSGNPPLLATAHALETEHASWNVFVAPAVLVIALALIVGAVVVKRRRTGRTSPLRSEATARGSLP